MYALVKYSIRSDWMYINEIDISADKITQICCYNGIENYNGSTYNYTKCRNKAVLWIESESLEDLKVQAVLEAL